MSPFIVKYVVTHPFAEDRPGYWEKYKLKGHEGVDLVPEGKQDWGVHAIKGGTVCFDHDPRDTAYGNSVRIVSDDGYVICYCHLSENCVMLGQDVEEGQLIGIMGNTGNSFGAHLHLGVYKVDAKGERLDVNNGYAGYIDPIKALGA